MKKKKIIIFSLLFLVQLILAAAETFPQFPAEITLPENFLTNALQPILQKAALFVGGIFGLYLIFILMQFHRERKKIKLLQDIRNDLDLLTQHFGVKHSHEKRGILQRLLGIFHTDEINKKKKREN